MTTNQTATTATATAAPAAPQVVAATTKTAAKAIKVGRPTTKAIRELKPETKVVLGAKVVKSSTGNLSIDHTTCKHPITGAEGKKARNACRTRILKHVKQNAKIRTTK